MQTFSILVLIVFAIGLAVIIALLLRQKQAPQSDLF